MIDDMRMNDYELFIDSSVKGFSPKGSSDVMELITKVAKRLTFDYFKVWKEWYELSHFGYLMSELSREKVYLVTIPENTNDYVEGKNTYLVRVGFLIRLLTFMLIEVRL
jgi:hypothetical protein